MKTKLITICLTLLLCSSLHADDLSMKLFDELQDDMLKPANDYLDALEELQNLNLNSHEVVDNNGKINIKFPLSVKKSISTKINTYLVKMDSSLSKMESYLQTKENNSECLNDLKIFKQERVPLLKQDLNEFKAINLSTAEDRELAWAKTITLTLTGPAIAYNKLLLSTGVKCVLF